MSKGYKQPIPFRYISRLAKLRMKDLKALAVIVQAKKRQRLKGGMWKAGPGWTLIRCSRNSSGRRESDRKRQA